jgi:hypothetical protein
MAHGDRVIAACVALQALRDPSRHTYADPEDGKAKEYPLGSMGTRFKEYEEREKRAADEWDDRTNWDLAYPGHSLAIR